MTNTITCSTIEELKGAIKKYGCLIDPAGTELRWSNETGDFIAKKKGVTETRIALWQWVSVELTILNEEHYIRHVGGGIFEPVPPGEVQQIDPCNGCQIPSCSKCEILKPKRKYHAEIKPLKPKSKYHVQVKPGIWIDVYDVLNAFDVECHAIGHAIKKLLKPGQRGYKDAEQDKREAIASIERSIEIKKPL